MPSYPVRPKNLKKAGLNEDNVAALRNLTKRVDFLYEGTINNGAGSIVWNPTTGTYQVTRSDGTVYNLIMEEVNDPLDSSGNPNDYSYFPRADSGAVLKNSVLQEKEKSLAMNMVPSSDGTKPSFRISGDSGAGLDLYQNTSRTLAARFSTDITTATTTLRSQQKFRFDIGTSEAMRIDTNLKVTIGTLVVDTDFQTPFADFDVTASVTRETARLWWNNDDNAKTLMIGGEGDHVDIKVGESNYFRVRASSAITKGQVVMITGSVGSSGGLTAAPATGLTKTESSKIMGIAAEDIALNSWGYITEFGLLRLIDTSAFSDGDILYYDPSVTGGLTTTEPSAPNPKVEIAAVVLADASAGSIFIRPNHHFELNELNDVNTTGVSNGDLLKYNSTSDIWEDTPQSSIAAGTADTLATARTISLTGDVSGSTSFDGSANVSITATVADDSHNHIIANVDGLQAALDAKQDSSTALTTTTTFGGDVSGTYNAIVVADDSHNHIIANIDGLQTALDAKLETESDPVFVASPAYGITSTDISNWNTAYGWGDHSTAGYLTSYTETDPTVPSHVKAITATQISNWDTAYGWGDHSTAGYQPSATALTTSTNFGGDVSGTYNAITLDATLTPLRATELSSSVDLDNLVAANAGFYYQTANADTTGNNYPSGEAGSLIVQKSAGNATQLYQTYNSSSPKMFFRANYTTGYGSWYQVLATGGETQTKSGILISSASLRAPIFYDTNDTAYYANPASTSVFNDLTLSGQGVVRNSAGHTSNLDTFYTGDMFGWTTTTTGKPSPSYGQGIAIVSNGRTHNNSSNWITQLGFGTDRNTAFFRGKTNAGSWGSWHQLFHSSYAPFDGLTSKTSGTGTYTTSGDFRAPIFYDSNNTGYYSNPNGTSNFNIVTAITTNSTLCKASEFRTASGNEFIINGGESHVYATGQVGNEKIFLNCESGIEVNSSPDNWASGWAGRDTATINAAGGASSFPGSVTIDGLKLQDSTNRAGLLEVSGSTGAWSGFSIAHTSTSHWSFMGHQTNVGVYDDANNEWIWRYNENSSLELRHNGVTQATTESGYLRATNQMRAPIYYDSDNTSYYVDPANSGTAVTVNGQINIRSRLSFSHDDTNANITNNTGHTLLYGASGSSMIYHIGTTEHMRLNNNGKLLLGTGSEFDTVSYLKIQSLGGLATKINTSALTSQCSFFNSNGRVGYIATQNLSTTYSTLSDQRVKHDIVDAPEASSLIDDIQVRSFKWNTDNSEQRYGMIAQELIQVAPEAVVGDPDGEEMMAVDYSTLVPMLIKEVQSLRKRVAQLEGN